MSHLSKVFTQIPVDIPNRSGFDLSHEALGTMKVGTLTPVMVTELLPNDTISLGVLSQITLPPMATDFYGRVDCRLEVFFVPNRILWAGWERFITLPISNPWSSHGGTDYRDVAVPYFSLECDPTEYQVDTEFNAVFGAGSLSDYLGNKSTLQVVTDDNVTYYLGYNILPYVGYHKIWDEFYRESTIQTPIFGRAASYSGTVGSLPYETSSSTSNVPLCFKTDTLHDVYQNVTGAETQSAGSSHPLVFSDGMSVFSLRQRNWAKDYITTAHLYPQSNDSTAGVSITSEDSASDVTIPDLRAANVIQRWIERNNIAGTRYSDQMKATFGVTPSDAVLDRPVFLGSTKFGVYNKSVYNTTGVSNSTAGRNPFYSVGSNGAASKGMGDSSLVDSFTANEHGYLYVIASIVPHLYYSTGTKRMLQRRLASDFANPLLQGLGEQPIHTWELTGGFSAFSSSVQYGVTAASNTGLAEAMSDNSSATALSTTYGSVLQSSDDVFGYTQQYADYKYMEDTISGLLRDGENLQYFALQASYEDGVELGSDFLQIPTDYMDNVTAVSAALSDYGAWYDFYFTFKKVSTLSEYVIPTLGDLKNTHKENIDYNGRRL